MIGTWTGSGASWRCPGGPARDRPDRAPAGRASAAVIRCAQAAAPRPTRRGPMPGPTLEDPMPDDPRPRFYLTTAIAYANSQPGLHTLYEVIGADAIARWHRMLGDDIRFLTGTAE